MAGIITVLWSCILVRPPAAEVATPVATGATEVAPLDGGHTAWGKFLGGILRPSGVDYQTAHRQQADLDYYRIQLAAATVPEDRAGRMALWINAYNALTVALVLQTIPEEQLTYGKASVRNVEGFWKSYAFNVAGQWVTLDAIEHTILRPMGDARIHMAVNCASRSCPAIFSEPFTAADLDRQLTAVATNFVNDPYHVRLQDGKLEVNQILSWFGGDFTASGGVQAFLKTYAQPGPVRDYMNGTGSIGYWDYDWSLNRADTE